MGNHRYYSQSEVCEGWVNEANEHGPFEVLAVTKSETSRSVTCRIRFINQNIFGQYTELDISRDHAIEINVRDPYQATIYNIGAVGLGYKRHEDPFKDKLFNIWRGMMRYCNEQPDKNSVSDPRFRCFETFCQDIQNFDNYSDFINDMDKYTIIKKPGCVEYTFDNIYIVDKSKSNLQGVKSETGYRGVYQRGNGFVCKINNVIYGTYKTAEAAASMYNHVMRYRGYGEEFLNTNIKEIGLYDLRDNYQLHPIMEPNKKRVLYTLYDDIDVESRVRRFEADFDKIWPNGGDPVKIIEVLPKEPTNERLVTIEFQVPNMFGFNTIATRVKHSWLTNDRPYQDFYKPHISGVGCYGNRYNMIPDHGREYKLWYEMLVRCCVETSPMFKYYGALGITIDYRWRCFEYFLQDVVNLPGYDLWKANPGEYHIDKDILQQNVPDYQKVYSPSTCMFIRQIDNVMDRHYRKSTNSTGYMGVWHDEENGLYYTKVNGVSYGSYPTAELAASLYNQISCNLNGVEPYNDVPYIPIDEILSYRRTRSTSKPDDYIIKAATGLDLLYEVVEGRRYMTDEQALDNLFNRFVKKKD